MVIPYMDIQLFVKLEPQQEHLMYASNIDPSHAHKYGNF